MLFCDGVGVGLDDPSDNVFAGGRCPHLDHLAGGAFVGLGASMGVRPVTPSSTTCTHVAGAIDATMGVPGRPQSATGQAALVTGVNAAREMGGHYGPWPGPTLRRMLDAGTIFHDGVSRHGTSHGGVSWATGYPKGFFDALRGGRLKTSSLVHAATSAGCSLPTFDDVHAGRAAPADFTGTGLDVRSGRGDEAVARSRGRALARHASRYMLTWFDAWSTDTVGHRADMDMARAIASRLDAFLAGLLDDLSASTTLVMVSDHGNLESVSTRHHTRSPVPLLALGPVAHTFEGIDDLMGVARALRKAVHRAEPR